MSAGRSAGARRFGRVVRAGAIALLAVSYAAPPALGQVRMRSDEARLLRDAANRESQGDFAGAERILRGVLDDAPGSSGALFALERVLNAQGRIGAILPVVDRFLESDPRSSGVRYLKLRVLLEVDSLDALRDEAERWMESEPGSEVPYREVARVYERAFGAERALALLRRGRSATGREGALALEIGDLLAASGDVDGAVDEWALAVGDDGAQTVTVIRRLQGLTSGSEAGARRLVAALDASGDPARRRAGARVALDLGLAEEALALTRSVAGDLEGRARESFLSDAARRAREQDLVDVASWAYDELGAAASTPVERRQFDQRIIDVALASGDTMTALEAQRRVAESFSTGSVDRRRAMARVIGLEAARSEPDRLRRMLVEFREEYPEAPELDALAAGVAAALGSRGDVEAAAAVLAGVDGPESSLEMGFLLLGDGDVEAGRGALLLAVTGLPPARATPVIQFAALFDRVSDEGSALLARSGVMAHRGDGVGAARALLDGVAALPAEDRPPLLAEAARVAGRSGAEELSAGIHRTIVDEHPDEPEAEEASLALARFVARRPDGRDEAIRLLEDLIARRPNAAVVPDARVELARLRSRG